jgi:uncharacterized protein (TIGR03084 family)
MGELDTPDASNEKPVPSFLNVLIAEQRSFDSLCESLSDEDWEIPTSAPGWSVRDQVSHLADTEEIAYDTTVGGPRTLSSEIDKRRIDGGVTEYGVVRGRQMASGRSVLEWWRTASARNVACLARADQSVRIPWGLGMSWQSFVTARTMEHWAHALDVAGASGLDYPDTDRLEHIAYLSYRSLPYAFKVAEVEPPAGRSLRLELTGPQGQRWIYGEDDATDLIAGSAGIWCRRAVQRIAVSEAMELDTRGPLAELAVQHARSFL